MKSIVMVLALSLASAAAFAQSPAEKADGAKPSDGAIMGGSIVPGETAGKPDPRGTPAPSARGVQRCNELSGTLRQECLDAERNNSANRSPEAAGATVPAPRAPDQPPPQNPR